MTKYELIRNRYESSGMTAKLFAKQESISVATLYKWLKKARDTQGAGEFISMDVSKPDNGQIRIQTPKGLVIEIPI